jgi:hypothetical protein
MAEMGTREVRIANQPPETSDRVIRVVLGPYGEIVAIHEENWSKMYRYPMANGIRVATINLDKHLPSHLIIAGGRPIVSYEGQPVSCYACGGIGHMRQTRPHRHSDVHVAQPTSDNTWVKVAATGKHIMGKFPGENKETNSQEAEDYQIKLKPWTKSGETTRNDLKTVEETQEPQNVQKEGGAAKQREENIHLDWTEEAITQEEDQAEKMEVSTENLSEKEKAGRPDTTQESRGQKPTASDEISDEENEQRESQTSCRRIARIDVQSKTETAKNQVLRSKKIKLEPGRDQKTAEKKQEPDSTTTDKR